MFGELKEVKNFKKWQNQESYNVKYFKEIKHSERVQKAGAYLALKRVSTMELFYEYT